MSTDATTSNKSEDTAITAHNVKVSPLASLSSDVAVSPPWRAISGLAALLVLVPSFGSAAGYLLPVVDTEWLDDDEEDDEEAVSDAVSVPVRGPDGAGTLPDDPLAGLALAGDAVTGNLRLGGDATTEIVKMLSLVCLPTQCDKNYETMQTRPLCLLYTGNGKL